MKPTPTASLLNRVESSAFEHALFLTYSLDLQFFEETILRHLLRRECRNVAVFADEAHAAAQQVLLARAVTSRAGWPCGRLYSLTPVFHSGAFHPKVAFLIGENEVEAWIGSGNLEPGGLRANLEVLNVLRCGRDGDGDEAGLIGEVWRYIKMDVATSISPVVTRQLEQVESSLPWLSREIRPIANARLVVGPRQDAIEEIIEAVGKTDVKRLILLAPFFDANLVAADALIDALKPRSTAILIQPGTVSIPGQKIAALKGAAVYQLRVERYAHAKLVIVEAKGRSVMLSGSHNISAGAMRGKNFEAGVIRIANGETDFSSALGLLGDLAPGNKLVGKELAGLRLRLRDNRLPDNVKSLLVGAELEGECLRVFAAKPLMSDQARLIPFINGKEAKALEVAFRVTGSTFECTLNGVETAKWTAVSLDLGKTVTAPVALTRPIDIIQRFKPRVRPPKAVEEGRPENLTLVDVDELIQEFAALMADEFRARKLAGRRKPTPAEEPGKKGNVKAMRYEEFVVSWRGPTVSDGARGDERSDVEWVLASLVYVTGGSRVPMPIPRVGVSELDGFLDDDSSLADEGVHLEEAMMDGQMEDGAAIPTPKEQPPVNTARPQRRESRLKTAKNIARQLKRFATSFPELIYQFADGDGDLPLTGLEGLLNAGRFLTSMLGRKERYRIEEVEYLPLDVWAQFNAGLLRVLSSRDLSFIKRLPLRRIDSALARRWQTALAGYLLLVHAFHLHPDIEEGARLNLRIGLRLAGHILGVDKKGDGTDIVGFAERMIGSMHPGMKIPPLAWDRWVETVAYLRKVDEALSSEFETGADIQRASRGNIQPETGQWVWWPKVKGLAVVTRVQSRSVRIMHEPCCEEAVVDSAFVVPVPAERPS